MSLRGTRGNSINSNNGLPRVNESVGSVLDRFDVMFLEGSNGWRRRFS